MPYRDLRAFIERLDATGDLARIRRPVSLVFEIAAGIRKMSDTKGPALLFENVVGHSIPVAGAIFTDRRKALLAFEVDSHEEAHAKFLEGLHNPIPPRLVAGGPCQEVVLTGDDVDLTAFPIPTYSERDGGPYITVALEISKDPVDRGKNASVYRMQLIDRNHLAVMSHVFQGLGTHMARAEKLGQTLDVAVVNGVDPVLLYASQAKVPPGFDELEIAGGINREPVETVRCQTVDLEVPATAEIVVEGRILPGERFMEGPFGEFTGYYGPPEPNPVMEVTAITHRHDPIYLAGMTGVPTTDNHVLKAFAYESVLLEDLRQVFPEVKAVSIPDWGGVQYSVVVGLDQRYKGQARHLILTALGHSSRPKWVIVVDDDIDVHDTEKVLWACITRSQPAEDILVIPRVAGGPLDPSAPEKEVISLMGLDATRPFGVEFPEVCRVPGADAFRLDDELPAGDRAGH